MPPRLRAAAERSRIPPAGTLALAAALLAYGWLTGVVPPSLVLDDARAARDYDHQTLAWLDGRWDVPYAGSGFERFEIAGRYYMYHGPVPALLRVPFAELVAAFPMKAGFLSVFLAVATGLWAALRIFEELTGEPPGPLAVMAVAGLPLVIASRLVIYHEAIGWGSAFALLAALQALLYQRAPSLPRLAAVAAAGFLAAFARETWLLGMIVLLMSLACAAIVRVGDPADRFRGPGRLKAWLGLPEVGRPVLHAGLAAIAVAAMLFTAAAIHRVKFGGWGFTPPIERHVVFARDPARLARIGGRVFHVANLRTGLYNYLSPTTASWDATFPWLHPVARLRVFPEARLDGYEHMMGLPLVAGGLMLATVAGVMAAARGRARRDALPALAGTALTASACFFFVGLCGRYLYDFFPALVIGAALGWTSVRQARSRWARAGFALLVLANLAASAALAVAIELHSGPLPGRQQVQRVADRIDRAILEPAARLDGRTCPMPAARRVAVRLRAAGRPMDRDDPIVVTGTPGAANFLSLRRFVDGTGAFAFRAWGSQEAFGRRFPIDARVWHELEVRFDTPGVVRVYQDGLLMLLHSGLVHEVAGRSVWLGRNPVGGPALAPRFAGELDCGLGP